MAITGPSLRAHVNQALEIHEGASKVVAPRDYDLIMGKFVELQKAVQALGASGGDVKSIHQFVQLKNQAMNALKPLRKSIEAMIESVVHPENGKFNADIQGALCLEGNAIEGPMTKSQALAAIRKAKSTWVTCHCIGDEYGRVHDSMFFKVPKSEALFQVGHHPEGTYFMATLRADGDFYFG